MKRHWDYTPGEFFDFLYGKVKAIYSGRGGGKRAFEEISLRYSKEGHARLIWMAERIGKPFRRADLYGAAGVPQDTPTLYHLAALVKAGALLCKIEEAPPDSTRVGRAPRYSYTPTDVVLKHLQYYDTCNPTRSELPWDPKTS
jgi:hypothetical protein